MRLWNDAEAVNAGLVRVNGVDYAVYRDGEQDAWRYDVLAGLTSLRSNDYVKSDSCAVYAQDNPFAGIAINMMRFFDEAPAVDITDYDFNYPGIQLRTGSTIKECTDFILTMPLEGVLPDGSVVRFAGVDLALDDEGLVTLNNWL